VEDRIRIQNLVFPEGLSIRAENREYLTKKMNLIFALIPIITGGEKGTENEKTHQNVDGFSSVAGTGLEPVTFGL
jgi:site-specific DNA recombinase